jgi:glycosyltransferase involved in cell wall biosynthesis
LGDNDTAGAADAPPIPDRRRTSPISVLSLASADAGHGAGVVAAELHRALTALGLRSTLLVKERLRGGDGIVELRRTRGGRWLLFHVQRIERKTGYLHVLHPSSPGIPFAEKLAGADVLQLHDIHTNYVSPAAAARWSMRLPVVWTLHDRWAATGKCLFNMDCERWLTGCGECPQLGEWPVAERDRTAFLWRWKRRLWADARFHLVAPSRSLAEFVARSPLLRHLPLEVIPNPVDADVFRSGRNDEERARLGIPRDAFVVAFLSNPSLPRKGLARLVAATQAGRAAGRVHLLIAAQRPPGADDAKGVVWAGARPAGEPVAQLLRAADALALASETENAPLVLLEAAATGLPVVAFDVGGVPEIVEHGRTGLLVPVGDDAALRESIDALAADANRRREFGDAARARVLREFAAPVVAARYAALYARVAARE